MPAGEIVKVEPFGGKVEDGVSVLEVSGVVGTVAEKAWPGAVVEWAVAELVTTVTFWLGMTWVIAVAAVLVWRAVQQG